MVAYIAAVVKMKECPSRRLQPRLGRIAVPDEKTAPKLTREFLTNRKARGQDWSFTITIGGLSSAAAVHLPAPDVQHLGRLTPPGPTVALGRYQLSMERPPPSGCRSDEQTYLRPELGGHRKRAHKRGFSGSNAGPSF
jgi:hypothetical protein